MPRNYEAESHNLYQKARSLPFPAMVGDDVTEETPPRGGSFLLNLDGPSLSALSDGISLTTRLLQLQQWYIDKGSNENPLAPIAYRMALFEVINMSRYYPILGGSEIEVDTATSTLPSPPIQLIKFGDAKTQFPTDTGHFPDGADNDLWLVVYFPKGLKGDTGQTGQTGATGQTGQTGATGQKGDKGDTGGNGGKGDKGDPGKGNPGNNGNIPNGGEEPPGAAPDKGPAGGDIHVHLPHCIALIDWGPRGPGVEWKNAPFQDYLADLLNGIAGYNKATKYITGISLHLNGNSWLTWGGIDVPIGFQIVNPPRPATVTGADGVTIEFGYEDLSGTAHIGTTGADNDTDPTASTAIIPPHALVPASGEPTEGGPLPAPQGSVTFGARVWNSIAQVPLLPITSPATFDGIFIQMPSFLNWIADNTPGVTDGPNRVVRVELCVEAFTYAPIATPGFCGLDYSWIQGQASAVGLDDYSGWADNGDIIYGGGAYEGTDQPNLQGNQCVLFPTNGSYVQFHLTPTFDWTQINVSWRTNHIDGLPEDTDPRDIVTAGASMTVAFGRWEGTRGEFVPFTYAPADNMAIIDDGTTLVQNWAHNEVVVRLTCNAPVDLPAGATRWFAMYGVRLMNSAFGPLPGQPNTDF